MTLIFVSVKKLLFIVRRNYLVKFCQWYYVTLQKWTFSIPTLHENWPKITVIWKLLICKSFHNLPHPIELVTVHIQVLWNLIFGGKSFLNSFRGCVYYSDLAVWRSLSWSHSTFHNVDYFAITILFISELKVHCKLRVRSTKLST